MSVVRVEAEIAAPPERVFALLTDHEGFGRMPGMVAKLLEEGSPERNGLGALRSLGGAGIAMHERVTAWEPPRAYEYRVVGGTVKLDHRGGRVEVEPTPRGSRVTWTTEVGGLAGVLGRPIVRSALSRMLAFVKKTAERETPA